MNLAKTARTLGLLTLVIGVSPFAMAENDGWYLGFNDGRSKAKLDDAQITSGLLGGGFATATFDEDDRDNGFKVFGGYQFNKNFALEGGYFDLGKFGFDAPTVPLGMLHGGMQLRGVNLDAVGLLPLSEKFSLFGRVGLTYAQSRNTFSGTGATTVTNANPSRLAMNYKLGVGVQYAFTESIQLRAEAERYRVNDALGNKGNIDLFSIGLIYRFGLKVPARPPEPMPVMATAPPEPAPEPAPKAVMSPPTPVSETFPAESPFDLSNPVAQPQRQLRLHIHPHLAD